MNEILTAKEVAEELHCSKAQVYKLMNGEVKNRTMLPHIDLRTQKRWQPREFLFLGAARKKIPASNRI